MRNSPARRLPSEKGWGRSWPWRRRYSHWRPSSWLRLPECPGGVPEVPREVPAARPGGAGSSISARPRAIGWGFLPRRSLIRSSCCRTCRSRSGIVSAAVATNSCAWRKSSSEAEPLSTKTWVRRSESWREAQRAAARCPGISPIREVENKPWPRWRPPNVITARRPHSLASNAVAGGFRFSPVFAPEIEIPDHGQVQFAAF